MFLQKCQDQSQVMKGRLVNKYPTNTENGGKKRTRKPNWTEEQVFVQRRSTSISDEEILLREFCIQPPPDINWISSVPAVYIPDNKTNSTNTSLKSDLDETTENTSPVVKLKVPGVTTLSESVSHSSSAAPDVRLTQHPNAPNQAEYLPGNKDLDETTATTSPVVKLPRVNTPSEKVSHRRSAHPCDRVKRQLNFPYQSFRHKRSTGNGPDNCCFKFYPRRIRADLVESYYLTDHRCLKPGAIFITKKSRSVCVDASASWTQRIMKRLDQSSF
ncbi:uncharacterized protein LOC113011568 [Astatotilapia calliptera]|uniref:uncharacterized protein LOC113011568 n=1 Tax=Astatotilapia calliptera TaxID=8154 RepID=UPI000E40DA20|nr:uncharacterized protein LOC113011568 [Astatotilapia calliptera]